MGFRAGMVFDGKYLHLVDDGHGLRLEWVARPGQLDQLEEST